MSCFLDLCVCVSCSPAMMFAHCWSSCLFSGLWIGFVWWVNTSPGSGCEDAGWPTAAVTLVPETWANAWQPGGHGLECLHLKSSHRAGSEIGVHVEQVWLWGLAWALCFEGQPWCENGKTALWRPHSSVFSPGICSCSGCWLLQWQKLPVSFEEQVTGVCANEHYWVLLCESCEEYSCRDWGGS